MTETHTDERPAARIDFASEIIASGIADKPVANLVETAMERLVAAGYRVWPRMRYRD